MTLRSAELRKWERRQRRSDRVRRKVRGTSERPRLSVYRSHRHFHAQVIDDTTGRTLASASTLQKDLREQIPHGGNIRGAQLAGEKIAGIAKEKGITRVVFDRGFYRFHGRVKAFAEAAAAGGLLFLVNPNKKKKEKKEKKDRKGKKGEAKKDKKDKKEKKDKKDKKEKKG